jgi:cytochrome-b5 reductase
VFSKPTFWTAVVAGGGLSYYVGRSYFQSSATQKSNEVASNAQKVSQLLNPKEFIPMKLVSKEQLTHNTFHLKFGFPHVAFSEDTPIGLNVASCILVKTEMDVKDKDGNVTKKPVIRPYTPTSSVNDKGFLELVIKRYPSGAMSRTLADMKVGDEILVKGPLSKIEYQPNKWNHVGMIAGGTGITPMYQVLKYALEDSGSDDKTKFTLLFGNMTENDILLRDELEQLAKSHPDRLKIYHHLAAPSSAWKGWKGFQSKEMIVQSGLPKKGEENTILFICGSPDMMNAVSGDKNPDKSQGDVKKDSILGKMGYDSKQVFKF